ncbi:MAG: arylamine N-acetyltransferase family protein, partial [Terriglobales bacterium]
GSDGPDFDHLTLRVDFPSDPLAPPYLADVGFGDSFLEPLLLNPGLEQHQIGRIYRLTESDGQFALEEYVEEPKAEWKRRYAFTLESREIGEFASMCHYQQTSPKSHFTRQRICSRATAHGRVTLSDLKLIETIDGRREERMMATEEEWRTTLRELFKIRLSAAATPQ